MAQRLLKRAPRKISPRHTEGAAGKVVLVGTYRRGQLERWPGYYNYPISEDDFSAAGTRGEDLAQGNPCEAANPRDTKKDWLPLVNELWLFLGAKAGRFYSAEFVGIFTHAELEVEYFVIAVL